MWPWLNYHHLIGFAWVLLNGFTLPHIRRDGVCWRRAGTNKSIAWRKRPRRHELRSIWVSWNIFFFMLDEWCYLVNGIWLGINENGRPSIQLYLERHMFQVHGALQNGTYTSWSFLRHFWCFKISPKTKSVFFFKLNLNKNQVRWHNSRSLM